MHAFIKLLKNGSHERRFSIRPTGGGWEVREEEDSRVIRQARYTDWHRVERARRAFALEMIDLRQKGWAEN